MSIENIENNNKEIDPREEEGAIDIALDMMEEAFGDKDPERSSVADRSKLPHNRVDE